MKAESARSDPFFCSVCTIAKLFCCATIQTFQGIRTEAEQTRILPKELWILASNEQNDNFFALHLSGSLAAPLGRTHGENGKWKKKLKQKIRNKSCCTFLYAKSSFCSFCRSARGCWPFPRINFHISMGFFC